MRVFITGASGYVGTAATTALAQRGHTPMGLARSTRVAAAVAATGATPVRGSLGDVDLLRELAGQADAVLHLGYDPQHPAAGDIDAAAVDALLAGVRRVAPVIYGSAPVVYGDTGAEPIDDDPPAHLSPYAQRRIDVERQVLSATRAAGSVVRPALVHGHGGSPPLLALDQRFTGAHARPAGLGAHGTRPADRPPIRGLPQRPLTSQRGTPGTSMPASRRPNVPQRDSRQRAGALSGLGNPARVAAWIIRS